MAWVVIHWLSAQNDHALIHWLGAARNVLKRFRNHCNVPNKHTTIMMMIKMIMTTVIAMMTMINALPSQRWTTATAPLVAVTGVVWRKRREATRVAVNPITWV